MCISIIVLARAANTATVQVILTETGLISDFLQTILYSLCFFSICLQVDLRHIDEVFGSNVVNIGVDLSEFYTSVEWDILEVPAVR